MKTADPLETAAAATAGSNTKPTLGGDGFNGRYRPRATPEHSLQNGLLSLIQLPGFVIDEFTLMNNT